jgi:hypothetical protein
MEKGEVAGRVDTHGVVNLRRTYRRGLIALLLSFLTIAIFFRDTVPLPELFSCRWLGTCNRVSNDCFFGRIDPETGECVFRTPEPQPQFPILPTKLGPPMNALEELHYALETMQNFYFQLWVGTWPSCIDWTGAVLGTLVSASLFSLSRSLEYVLPLADSIHSIPPSQSKEVTLEGQLIENEINKYFSQSIAYYFGQDAFGIRTQAYDDMLWVVLGWLESVRFVKLHTDAHYMGTEDEQKAWYGKQFVPAFSHRARVFYDIAAKGWDTKLCGGGMNWNPHLTPYKNAITNELYISASIGMYLDFPGDRNEAPFVSAQDQAKGKSRDGDTAEGMTSPAKAHDPVYLNNAIEGYDWLKNSNMTNEKGLYVDGFHIKDWSRSNDTGTGKCDVRNEMVYTYNQGVLLSGLRSLWEGTGNRMYLEDGHELVRNVISATGWQSEYTRTADWSGLGRNGILQEICDEAGTCSQNGQTFKGIFFHHLTLFCEPLPEVPAVPGKTHGAGAIEASLHASSCHEYTQWVTWNARAAMGTRDAHGRFGMWWGANVNNINKRPIPTGAEDYRNDGLGDRARWGVGWKSGTGVTPPSRIEDEGIFVLGARVPSPAKGTPTDWVDVKTGRSFVKDPDFPQNLNASDINDRGRGRTVETQGGGVAVVRAMWEFVSRYDALLEDMPCGSDEEDRGCFCAKGFKPKHCTQIYDLPDDLELYGDALE